MLDPNSNVTAKDLREVAWHEVIASVPDKSCHEYMAAFIRKMNKAETSEAQTEYSVYRLLAQVTSLHLHHESAADPFGPLTILRGSRSAIPDDFSEAQLKALEEVVFDIQDAELRARIADIVWLRLRKFRAAVLAVDSYLESASILEHPDHWPDTYERIERALRLAATLGKGGKEPFGRVIDHIELTLTKYNGEDPLFLSQKLMELLLEFSQGDPAKYITISEKAATQAESKGEWFRARAYWDTTSKWQVKAKHHDDATKTRIKAAETYVSEAAAATSSMAAATHMEHAVEAYRRIGGQQQRSEELYKKLLEYQQKMLGEMKHISTELDLSEAIQHARSAVSDKSLRDAIMALCLIVRPSSVERLRQQVEDLARKYPMQFLVSAELVDSEGKVIARMPDLFTANADERENAFRAHMFRQTEQTYLVETQGAIEPARRQILLEHNIAQGDFLPFLSNNPLVRPGREYLYAEGLHAGFMGDWVKSAHILIPQFEDSMRFVLQNMGVTTSGLSKGVQDERSLNVTLYAPEVEEAFGPDITFDLQSLLVERFGHNLRNNLAHGLMSHNAFYDVSVVYLWWLILRLMCSPTISQSKRRAQ